MSSGLQKIIDNHNMSLEPDWEPTYNFKYRHYCMSNLRGGIGKSTLSFNLAYLFSRHKRTIAADLCAQRNLTESVTQNKSLPVNISDALTPKLLGSAFGEQPEEISFNLSQQNDNFIGGKKSYIIPGSADLFAFPSSLYQQLQQAVASNNQRAVKNILLSLRSIIDDQARNLGCELTLMDCSPFYAGATHLAWCAADAIIIPVRVDEHSIESLKLTLKMLGDSGSDYNMWAERAGGLARPKVASIVMTMVGARSPEKGVKDRASQMYVERAYEVACQYPELFDFDDPADAFAITDDFMSAGRISGAEGIPIPRLQVGKFHTIGGKRLQVNKSQAKYRRELEYIVSML